MTRLRFAPSPTGALHIGGIRTALYNFLLAKKLGGQFILRIEDTDQARFVQGAEEYIIRSLDWLGLTPDEGPVQGGPHAPYRQSDRTRLYRDLAHKLVETGKAYLAFDTPEELDQMRQRLSDQGISTPKYDASVRSQMSNSLVLSEKQVTEYLAEKKPYTIRLRVDPDHAVVIRDKIRGEVVFAGSELDDKILLKADGYPTYHLANVVDDHLMQITDVIRGEEWLPSTGHHVLLYRAFGWEHTMPSFSHLPLILKPNGQGKLSKRDGQKFGFPVFPLGWVAENPEDTILGFDTFGFEPEAVINFLAFLGWNPGTEQELFSMDELIDAFDPERIHKSGARFDYDKALWFNQQYLQRLTYADVRDRMPELLQQAGLVMGSVNVASVFSLLQPRIHRLNEISTEGYYFFTDALDYEEAEISKKWLPEIETLLTTMANTFQQMSSFDANTTSLLAKEHINASGLKMGNVMPILRAALTGKTQGPDIWAIAEILGKDKTISRFRRFSTRQ